MIRYRVVYQRLAQHDLFSIFDYLKLDQPSFAEKLLKRIENVGASLKVFPRRGAIPRDKVLRRTGYRYLVVQDYLIFYRIVGQQVLIRRVIHGKRNYTHLL